jgi:hemolysin activation/secretion protein
MGLTIRWGFAGRTPSNYGEGASWARAGRHCRTVCLAIASLPLLLLGIGPAIGQQVNQPGFDPRQTERRFDALESGQTPPARPGLRMPQLARPAVAADTRPQFELRDVVITGAGAIPRGELIRAYQPYLGKKISQADLVAIAGAISDAYRAAGFHLSRAIVPPQDIRDGRVRIQVIEGSITEVALRGDGAEQFGIRPMLSPIVAECPS